MQRTPSISLEHVHDDGFRPGVAPDVADAEREPGVGPRRAARVGIEQRRLEARLVALLTERVAQRQPSLVLLGALPARLDEVVARVVQTGLAALRIGQVDAQRAVARRVGLGFGEAGVELEPGGRRAIEAARQVVGGGRQGKRGEQQGRQGPRKLGNLHGGAPLQDADRACGAGAGGGPAPRLLLVLGARQPRCNPAPVQVSAQRRNRLW
jgi:hypothetical protein